MNTEPTQSNEIGELSKALSVAQGKLQAVPRNAENPFFKSKYADLSSIIGAARATLAENGLSIVQFGLPTDNGKVALATQLNHISGQWIRGVMSAKPVKDDPQAMGSATAYLRRYGYSAMIGLVQEGEDDDGNHASAKPETGHPATWNKPAVTQQIRNGQQNKGHSTQPLKRHQLHRVRLPPPKRQRYVMNDLWPCSAPTRVPLTRYSGITG